MSLISDDEVDDKQNLPQNLPKIFILVDLDVYYGMLVCIGTKVLITCGWVVGWGLT